MHTSTRNLVLKGNMLKGVYGSPHVFYLKAVVKGAGTPPTRPSHAKPIKVAMED